MKLSKAKDEEEYQVLRERFVQGVGGESAISYLEQINGSSWLDFMAPVKRYGRRANATWVVNKWADIEGVQAGMNGSTTSVGASIDFVTPTHRSTAGKPSTGCTTRSATATSRGACWSS